ncbi:MAG: hypothetical protein ABSA22_00390 [Acidimicrobiales bacterium]
MRAIARRALLSTREARSALSAGCVVLTALLMFGPATTSAAAAANPIPQFVVRAGTSNDVYALLKDSAFPHANAIERSTNGGESFQRMGSLPISRFDLRYEPVISQLLFPTANVGVAVAYSVKSRLGTATPLYLTRDGGKTWSIHEISPTTEIQQITTTSRYLYAIAANCPKSDRCSSWRLERSTLSALDWVSLPLPPKIAKYDIGLGFTAFGNDVWLNTVDQVSKPYPSYLAISRNLGATYSVSVQPDLQSVSACDLQAVSFEVLWATCGDGNMQGQIPYSDDGGAHWIVKDSTSILSSFAFGSFDPVSSAAAFAVDGNYPDRLYEATNGSTAPRVVASVLPKRFPLTVCFVNARDGVVLVQGIGGGPNATVWSTQDRGAHWRRVLQ